VLFIGLLAVFEATVGVARSAVDAGPSSVTPA